jgi:hypothetical protein
MLQPFIRFTDATIQKSRTTLFYKKKHDTYKGLYLPLFSFHWHALVHAYTLSEVVPARPCNLVVGVEEQDLLKGLEGILQVFLLLVCVTQVVPRCHVPWLKLHRLLELLDRLVQFVVSLVAHSQSIVHLVTNKNQIT